MSGLELPIGIILYTHLNVRRSRPLDSIDTLNPVLLCYISPTPPSSIPLIPPHRYISLFLHIFLLKYHTMALDRLKSVSQHLTGGAPPHPFDPLSNAEIESAVQIVRKEHGQLAYNAVTLWEPRKKEMLKWIEDPSTPRPARVADVVAIAPGGKVVEGLVDLKAGKVLKWDTLEGVQPLVSFGKIQLENFANGTRLPWKISSSLSMCAEKTQKSLSSA